MKTTQRLVRRSTTAIVLATVGLALSVAIWLNGSHAFALGVLVFYALAAFAAFRWAGGHGDVAAILGSSADERQRGLDRDATALAGLAAMLYALGGAIVSVARTGDPGAFGVICVVGGAAYVAALAALRRRR